MAHALRRRKSEQHLEYQHFPRGYELYYEDDLVMRFRHLRTGHHVNRAKYIKSTCLLTEDECDIYVVDGPEALAVVASKRLGPAAASEAFQLARGFRDGEVNYFMKGWAK